MGPAPDPDRPTLPRLGFGAGGLWAGGALDDDQAEALLDAAYAGGVSYFDTGPTYGNGRAEIRLASFLSSHPEALVSTKVGSHLGPDGSIAKDYSRDAIRRSMDASLGRLHRDVADVVYVHGPLAPEQLTSDLIETMGQLKADGVARAVGASCDGAVAEAVVASGAFDVLMTTLNVLTPAAFTIAGRARDAGMTVVAKSPLAHSVTEASSLLPRSRTSAWYFARVLRHYRRDLLPGVRAGRILRAEVGGRAVPASLRFVLAQGSADCAVVGTTKLHHLTELVDAASVPMEPSQAARIARRLGFSA